MVKPQKLDKLSESQEQQVIIAWVKLSTRKYPPLKLLYSTLNGVRLSMRQAIKAKREGNLKGVSDIVLPYPSGPYYGLYLELKIKGNYMTKEQKAWKENMARCGYFSACCYGSKEAIEVIESYIRVAKPIELV